MDPNLIFWSVISVIACAFGLFARREGKKYNLRQKTKKHGADFDGI